MVCPLVSDEVRRLGLSGVTLISSLAEISPHKPVWGLKDIYPVTTLFKNREMTLS
jgi:hypothetical protein